MPTARKFAMSLERAFRRHSRAAPFGEIAQFRALQLAFAALTPKFHVEEYHGAKRQVYFDTTQPWLRPRARCELCDLLILTFSTTGRPQVRLVLLQAKLSHNRHPGLCGSPGLLATPTVFRGNYEQWDLLSSRPQLDPTTTFAPPPDLLRAALVPSVGAFGVFHRDSTGRVDMFYAAADTLKPVGSPRSRYGNLSTSVAAPLRWFGRFADTPACCCVRTFGESLFQLRIGTPVALQPASGAAIRNEPLASFARSVLTSYVRGPGDNSLLALEALDLLGGRAPAGESASGAIPNLVIIKGAAPGARADEAPRERRARS